MKILAHGRFASRSMCSRSSFALVALVVAVIIGATYVPTPASAADRTERMYPGNVLYPGESVWSPNRLYRLIQQHDGNLVLQSMPGSKPLWSTGTHGNAGSVTKLQADGNLVVYAPGNRAIWASHTESHRNSILFVQNDANAVIYATGNVPVWATGYQSRGSCAEGSRSEASRLASTGAFVVGGRRVNFADPAPTMNTNHGWVELRYHPQSRCAWALAGGGVMNEFWVDRSRNGGRTWEGPLGVRTIGNGGIINASTISHSAAYRDGYSYVMRACIRVFPSYNNNIHCTNWY